jgi:hypothetical protein
LLVPLKLIIKATQLRINFFHLFAGYGYQFSALRGRGEIFFN